MEKCLEVGEGLVCWYQNDLHSEKQNALLKVKPVSNTGKPPASRFQVTAFNIEIDPFLASLPVVADSLKIRHFGPILAALQEQVIPTEILLTRLLTEGGLGSAYLKHPADWSIGLDENIKQGFLVDSRRETKFNIMDQLARRPILETSLRELNLGRIPDCFGNLRPRYYGGVRVYLVRPETAQLVGYRSLSLRSEYFGFWNQDGSLIESDLNSLLRLVADYCRLPASIDSPLSLAPVSLVNAIMRKIAEKHGFGNVGETFLEKNKLQA